MTEDDPPTRPARFTPLPLDRLGVEELQAYVARLRAEIESAEIEIGRKQDHMNAADSLFKKPS